MLYWFPFQKVLLKLYDGALRQTHTINQVHPFLLSNLRFPPDLFLSSVGLMDEEVCALRDRFLTGYKQALIPLKAYADEWKLHLELYTMDVNAYIEYVWFYCSLQ